MFGMVTMARLMKIIGLKILWRILFLLCEKHFEISIKLFIVFLIILSMSIGSIIMLPLSFPILVICVLLFF